MWRGPGVCKSPKMPNARNEGRRPPLTIILTHLDAICNGRDAKDFTELMRTSTQHIGVSPSAIQCVSASRLAGKLAEPNAFDSKETPSHRIGVTPCYCDKGDTPHVAVIVSLAAIGAAIGGSRSPSHLAGITE